MSTERIFSIFFRTFLASSAQPFVFELQAYHNLPASICHLAHDVLEHCSVRACPCYCASVDVQHFSQLKTETALTFR